jgi:hypothetical protein
VLRQAMVLVALALAVVLGAPPSGAAAAAPSLPPLSYVSFANARFGCVGGQGAAFCTWDGGAHWAAVYRGGNTPRAILFQRDRVWRLLAGTRLLRPTRGGWRAVTAQAFVTVAALGDTLVGLTPEHTILVSTNGGGKWLRVPLQDADWLGVHANIARVIDGKGTIWESAGGRFWSETGRVPSQHLDRLQLTFTGQKYGWLLEASASGCASQTPYEVLGTVDGGQVWKPVMAGSSACWPSGQPPYHVAGPSGYPVRIAANGLTLGWMLLVQPAAGRLTLIQVSPQKVVQERIIPGAGGLVQGGDLDMVTLDSGWIVATNNRGAGIVVHLVKDGRRWSWHELSPTQFFGGLTPARPELAAGMGALGRTAPVRWRGLRPAGPTARR